MTIKSKTTKQADKVDLLEVKGRDGSPYLVFPGRQKRKHCEQRYIDFLKRKASSNRK